MDLNLLKEINRSRKLMGITEGLNLVKVTPSSWLKLILNRTTGPHTFPERPDSVYYKLDGDVIFEYNKTNGHFFVDYNSVWSVFIHKFDLKYEEIVELIKSMVEDHYKWEILTVMYINGLLDWAWQTIANLDQDLVNEGLNDDKKIIDLTGIWYRLESNQQQSSIRQEIQEGLNLPKKTLESRIFACLDANGRINHSDNIDYEDNVIYISPTTSNDEELMPGWESSTPIKSGYKVSGYQIGAMAALTDCLNMELDVVRNDIRLHRQINGAILDWFLQNKSSALQEGLNVTKRDYKNEVVDIFKKVAKWYRVKFTPVENYKPQDNFRAVHFKFQLPTINNKQALISLGCQYANSDNNNIIYGTVKIISTESVSKSIRFTHEIDRHDIEGLIRVINANVITAVGQQS